MSKQVDVYIKTTLTVPDDLPLDVFERALQREVIADLNEEANEDAEEVWIAEDLFEEVPSEWVGKKWTVTFQQWSSWLEDPETGERVS